MLLPFNRRTDARCSLARFKLDALLIHSGEFSTSFSTITLIRLRSIRSLKAWVPVTQVPNCWLLVDGVNKPKCGVCPPVDYWHAGNPANVLLDRRSRVSSPLLPSKAMASAASCLPRVAIYALGGRPVPERAATWISPPATQPEKVLSTTALLPRL